MSDVDYPVNDFDNHYYEAIDAFTRHLDPRLGRRIIEEAAVHAAPVVRARRLGHARANVGPAAVVLPNAVGAGEDVGDPADLTFGICNAHVREAREQAGE